MVRAATALVLLVVVPCWGRVDFVRVGDGIQTMAPPLTFQTWVAPRPQAEGVDTVAADSAEAPASVRITGGRGSGAWLLGFRIRELPGTSWPAGIGWQMGDRTDLLVGLPDLELAGSPASLSLRLSIFEDRVLNAFTYHDNFISAILSRRLRPNDPSAVYLGFSWREESFSNAPDDPAFAPRTTLYLSTGYRRDTRDVLHYAAKSASPRLLRGLNNLFRPSGQPSLKEAPHKGGHPSRKEGDKTPIWLDSTS
jgi:hypothetical protein